jgi:small-conductance mechanosensitive channel
MVDLLNQLNISSRLITTALILLAALLLRVIAFAIIKTAIKRIEDDDPTTNTALEQRAYTLSSVIKGALNLIIYGIAFITIMSEWGIDVAPILTGAGIVGLAVGFGAQTLVKDAINGFFILLENQFNVGDQIEISGVKGKVVKLNLRNTVLRDESGVKHSIPNSKVDIVSKHSQ